MKAKAPSDSPSHAKIELSRFERRLVHQIIRAEYPDLRTYSEEGFVRVRSRGLEERDSAQDSLDRRIKRAMFHQNGFRWLAEALAGPSGNLEGIDHGACARQIDGEVPAKDLQSFEKRMDELQKALKARQPVLIGHNCLIDLIYFFKNFYGDLPDTIEEFQELVHSIFPVVIDTKYMATTGSGYWTFRSYQLSQLEEVLSKDAVPRIGTLLTPKLFSACPLS